MKGIYVHVRTSIMRVALPQSSKVGLLIEVSLCMHLKVINLSKFDDNDGGKSDGNDGLRRKHTFYARLFECDANNQSILNVTR